MTKRNATRSPWEVEEFASSSGKGVGEIEDVVEVDRVSHSVSHAEAADAPSPALGDVSTFGALSDVEQVDSRYDLELDPISRGASPASLI